MLRQTPSSEEVMQIFISSFYLHSSFFSSAFTFWSQLTKTKDLFVV